MDKLQLSLGTKPVAQEALTEALDKVVATGLIQGTERTAGGELIVTFSRPPTDTERLALQAVYQQHRGDEKSASEKAHAARESAAAALQRVDFDALDSWIAEVKESPEKEALRLLAGIARDQLAAQGLTKGSRA